MVIDADTDSLSGTGIVAAAVVVVVDGNLAMVFVGSLSATAGCTVMTANDAAGMGGHVSALGCCSFAWLHR